MSKINQRSFNLIIGKTFREYREKSSMTRSALALKSEVNEKYLGKIERGECSASSFILKKIANSLNTKLSIILKDL